MKQLLWAALLSGIMITGLAHYNRAKAGPSMSTHYVVFDKKQKVTDEMCLKKAAYLIKATGITGNVKVIETSIYSENEEYTIHIRCMAKHKMIYIVASGPESSVAVKIVSFISENF